MIGMSVSSNHRDWDEFLLFAYNSLLQETTGYTPIFLLHGCDPLLPVDVAMNFQRVKDARLDAFIVQRCLKLARELVEARELAAQAKNRTRYDRRRYEQTFHPGNLVYAESPTAAKNQKTKLLH